MHLVVMTTPPSESGEVDPAPGLAETSSAIDRGVSVTTTILTDRPTDPESTDRPVLVVIDLDRPAGTGPDPAALAGTPGSPVQLLIVAPRIGFSTDAALVAGAQSRLRQQAERALRGLRRQVPQLSGPADLVWYARTPFGRPVEQARRAVRRAARHYDARAVILPAHLMA
jgi:hypothetical protein